MKPFSNTHWHTKNMSCLEISNSGTCEELPAEKGGSNALPISFGSHPMGHFALYTVCSFLSCFALTLSFKEQALRQWIESLCAWKTFLVCCRYDCDKNTHCFPELPYHRHTLLQFCHWNTTIITLFCAPDEALANGSDILNGFCYFFWPRWEHVVSRELDVVQHISKCKN